MIDGVLQLPQGSSLATQLARLSLTAQSGGNYTVEINGNEYIAPVQARLPYGRTDLTITLVGSARSEVRLSANGSLFTVDSGVTLVLCENVTLVGRSTGGNGNEDNTASLVQVNSGGILEMNAGSRITGNTTGGWSSGGVNVFGGTFTMRGGEITGNTANSGWSGSGGGVNVFGGTFIMYGGEITDNTVNVDWGSSGGGVHVSGSSTFIMYGGEITGNTANGPLGGGGGIGGGVHASSGGTFIMRGREITGNDGLSGGGVFAHDSIFQIENGILGISFTKAIR